MSPDDRGHEVASLLEAHERALLDPTVRRNGERIQALLDDEFEEIGVSGRVWTRNEIVELLAGQVYEPPILSDFRCRLIAPGVALVTYRTEPACSSDGAPRAANRSSVWVKKNDRWRIRFHQGTPTG